MVGGSLKSVLMMSHFCPGSTPHTTLMRNCAKAQDCHLSKIFLFWLSKDMIHTNSLPNGFVVRSKSP